MVGKGLNTQVDLCRNSAIGSERCDRNKEVKSDHYKL